MLTEDLAPPSLSTRSGQTYAVLLVDDDDRYAGFVRTVFERVPGTQFLHVRRLDDILPTLAADRLSVILLDVNLPDGNGLQWLCVNRAELHAAVIVLTAFAEHELEEHVGTLAQDFLVKSEVEPEHLVRAVRYAADRERVRQQLLRSREYFQSLIENARDLITVVDERGIVLYQSPASLSILGRSAEASVGRPLAEIVHHEDVPRLREMLASVFGDDDTTPGGEFQIRHADGSYRVLDIVASRVAGGRRAVLNSRDVTERRREESMLRAQEDQLRQVMKMEAVGRLAGGIAHDFSNVLTVITGSCERLRDKLDAEAPGGEGPSGKSEIGTILNNCQRAASLTRQLLAFSRQQTLAPQPIDLGHLAGRAARLLKQLIGEHIALTIDIAPELPAVEADPVQIEQVLMNLAINARDAMPDGGSLHVKVQSALFDEEQARTRAPMKPGTYVLLQVTDTGCGMSLQTKARAFEPFFTTKGPTQGTGLGLSTVYGIVKQSGGFIYIDSEEGRGTTFSIYMPPSDAPPVYVETTRRTAPRTVKASTILLTEDDGDVRELLSDMLTASGHTVIAAENPADALAKAAAFGEHIDLLLTDVVMPGGTGRDLARRISEVRPELKILYISGYPEHGAAPGTVLEPGLPFLPKPFTRDQLLQKVHDMLA